MAHYHAFGDWTYEMLIAETVGSNNLPFHLDATVATLSLTCCPYPAIVQGIGEINAIEKTLCGVHITIIAYFSKERQHGLQHRVAAHRYLHPVHPVFLKS